MSRADAVAAAAQRLQAAADSGIPCAPVRDLIGSDDVDAAYAVQQELAKARQAAGGHVKGHKIGLTSPAVQAQLGVDRPDFGLLFDDMAVPHGDVIDITRLLQPKIEAEIAFVLAADIEDRAVTGEQVRAAVDYACAALEIVDSRVAGWDITLGDTVADNASSGLYTLGQIRLGLDRLEPADVTMTMTLDGELVSQGTGDACLGDPLNALAWLARVAIDVGTPLRAGQVILSGALGPMVAVPPGAHFEAQITGLGSVEAIFSDLAPLR
jgi:2-keto-4-pentenoate hydratase